MLAAFKAKRGAPVAPLADETVQGAYAPLTRHRRALTDTATPQGTAERAAELVQVEPDAEAAAAAAAAVAGAAQDQARRKARWRALATRVLYARATQTLLAALTVYALFGDDVRVAAMPKAADPFFYGVSAFTLVVFAAEVCLNWVCRDDYRYGFYFWLDIVAVVSLVPDIGWIPLALTLSAGSSVVTASRASRAGSRAGRVIRLVRLLRLLRISKLIKIQEIRREQHAAAHGVLPYEDLPLPASDAETIVLEDNGTCVSDDDDKAREENLEGLAEMVDLFARQSEAASPTSSKLPSFIGSNSSPLPSPVSGARPWSPAASQRSSASSDGFLAAAEQAGSPHGSDAAATADQEASNVGKRLMELTTRKVLIIGLFLILLLPFLEESFYSADAGEEAVILGLEALHRMPQDRNASGAISEGQFREECELYWRDAGRVLGFRVHGWDEAVTNAWLQALLFRRSEQDPFALRSDPDTGWKPSRDLLTDSEIDDEFRATEVLVMDFEVDACYNAAGIRISRDCRSSVFVDWREALQLEALINIFKTIFIIIILSLAVILFTRDADGLVVDPIERMIVIVKRIAADPMGRNARGRGDASWRQSSMSARKSPGFEDKTLEDIFGKGSARGGRAGRAAGRPPLGRGAEPETELLETALEKIAALLQVGFGIAGEAVITQCISKDGEDIDVMAPGRSVTTVVGFGIIHDFTAACSYLQEDVILFTNLLANIVHGACDMHNGAVNKNLGNAFLCVWKICDGPMAGLEDPRKATRRRRLDRDDSDASSLSALSPKGGLGTPTGTRLGAHAQLPPIGKPAFHAVHMMEDDGHEPSEMSVAMLEDARGGLGHSGGSAASAALAATRRLSALGLETGETGTFGNLGRPANARVSSTGAAVQSAEGLTGSSAMCVDIPERPSTASGRRPPARVQAANVLKPHRRVRTSESLAGELAGLGALAAEGGSSSSEELEATVNLGTRDSRDSSPGSPMFFSKTTDGVQIRPPYLPLKHGARQGSKQLRKHAVPMQKIEAALAAVVKVLNDLQHLQEDHSRGGVPKMQRRGSIGDAEEPSEAQGTLSHLVRTWEQREQEHCNANSVKSPVGHRTDDGDDDLATLSPKRRKIHLERKKVKMGFGLHLGWAIEGSIGSRYKVDMSYLSPNVNLAARLEAATAQFHCPLLVSGFLMSAVSPACRRVCRMIDVVTVKGSNIPIELWTFDINQTLESCLHLAANSRTRQRGRWQRARVYVDFGTHKDVDRMLYTDDEDERERISLFRITWSKAVHAYERGEWGRSLELLDEAEAQWEPARFDGPLKSLRNVMIDGEGAAPLDWSGFRKLTQK